MSNEPKAGMSIDPEVLAAYIDKRLSPEQRAAVEAQLAGDPDSYAVLVETIKALDSLPAGKKTSSTRAWVIAAGLVAAAAIALSVWLSPALLQRIRGERVDPGVARLVAAVGQERYVEARLSGGFEYGPLRAVTRGSNSSMKNLDLVAAAGALQKSAAASPSGAALHAWGVAQLLLADYDGAIRTLRAASTQRPGDASIHSDLAGALIARARSSDRPEDLAPALASADRALQVDAGHLEAAFNRALALEALQLDEQAMQAWQRYLQADATSAWAAEARSRLTALTAKPRASAWAPGGPITLQNAFRARDWLHATALPEWATAVASDAAASVLRDRVLDTCAELARVTSDRAFDAIAADVSLADVATLKRAASGYASLAAASNAVRADQLRQIGQHSREACAAFAAIGSTFLPACEVERASALMQERDFDTFRSELDRLRPIVKARGLRYAEGRVRWLDGMATMMTGRLLDASTPYGEAREIFMRIGEWPSAARMFNQESEAEYWSGRYQPSWQLRYRALQLASQVRDPFVSYSILSSVSAVLLNDRLAGPASTFAEASTRPWGVELPPLMTLFPLQRMLMAAVEAGDLERAGRARERLDQVVQGTSDPRLASMLGDVKVAAATLDLAQGRRDAAEKALTLAIETMGPEREFGSRLWALLGRAELFLQVGDSSRAIRDLDQVVDRLSTRTGAAVNLRVADAGRVRRVAAKVALAAGDADPQVVQLYDRARSVLDNRRSPGAVASSFALDQLPESSAVIATVDDGSHLGCWVLTRSRQSFHRLQSDAQAVRRLSSRLAFLANEGSAGSLAWHEALRELYDGLIKPLEPAIAGRSRIIIVPDGAWRGVPMQALLDTEMQPAAARWSFVQASSISAALSETSQRSQRANVLIVADPVAPDATPLPGARREAAALARIYDAPASAVVLIGKDATRSHILPLLADASTIHFAVHAVSDAVNPGQAFLQLAPDDQRGDGRWLVDELKPGSFDRSQTVILAACRSSEGDSDPSESVSSLAAAIMRAGAGTVIASLWPLDDTSSVPLFEEIHRGLKAGQRAEDALRTAVRSFTQAHPEPMAVAAVSGLQVFRTGLLPRRSHSESEDHGQD